MGESVEAEGIKSEGDGDESGWELTMPGSLEELDQLWTDMPSRYRIMFVTTCAFVICNMVRAVSGWHQSGRPRVESAQFQHVFQLLEITALFKPTMVFKCQP